MQIQSKLISGLIIAALLICCALYFVLQWTFDRGMMRYVNEREKQNIALLSANLTKYYQDHKNWDRLNKNRRLWLTIVNASYTGTHYESINLETPSTQRANPRTTAPKDRQRLNPRLRHTPPIALLNETRTLIVGRMDNIDDYHPIALNNATIGWIGMPKRLVLTRDVDIAFRQQQLFVFIVISLIMLAISICVAIPLARHFVKPIKALAKTTNALTDGNYDVELNATGKDEIADLARDIKTLRNTLKESERTRKIWISSISHELRTPLSIAIAEIDAMVEGIRNIKMANIISLQQEFHHLQTLVEDLYDLSNAELGLLSINKERIHLHSFCRTALERHNNTMRQKHISLTTQCPNTDIFIDIDPTRMDQVLDNVIVNACKYIPDTSQVLFTLNVLEDNVEIIFEDSGEGVPDDALEKLFDYLYRVEMSRNKQLGGSGLGLSICKKIVEAHGGHINARHSTLGGLAIEIHLPLDNATHPSS